MATRSVSLSGTDKEKASQIVEASQRLVSIGMNRGSCGNISARCETTFKGSDSFLVTPSGIDPEKMTPESICLMNMSGETVEGGKPSSEWRIHRDIYDSRPEIHAIVHTHSPFATTLACLQLEVPPFHYMIAVNRRQHDPPAHHMPCSAHELSDSDMLP